jgi:DNA-3-methyladenine glycosylase II
MDKKIRKHFQKADPVLYGASLTVGELALHPTDNYFERLCESIVNQQLSEKAGDTIFGRLKDLFPERKIDAQRLMKLPDDLLRGCGISRPKIAYMKAIAKEVCAETIPFPDFAKMTNDGVIEELVKLKGIGRWTAEMFLMFTLGREDIFSYGDLGLRRGMQKLYKLKKEPSIRTAERISKKWSPYRTYACLILWRSL